MLCFLNILISYCKTKFVNTHTEDVCWNTTLWSTLIYLLYINLFMGTEKCSTTFLRHLPKTPMNCKFWFFLVFFYIFTSIKICPYPRNNFIFSLMINYLILNVLNMNLFFRPIRPFMPLLLTAFYPN